MAPCPTWPLANIATSMSTDEWIGSKSGNLVWEKVRYVEKVKNHWFRCFDGKRLLMTIVVDKNNLLLSSLKVVSNSFQQEF